MTERKVLVDTSAWVEFLSSSIGELGDKVKLTIERDQAVICGVIIAELLQGATDKRAQQQLNFLYSQVTSLPIGESVMLLAGQKLQQLRGKNIALPFPVAVIAAVAEEHDVPVLSADSRFDALGVERIEIGA